MEIKRIIFDLDNTLIDWIDEYASGTAKAFEELNLPYTMEDIKKLDNAQLIYESGIFKTYNKKDMLATFEKELGYKLPEKFLTLCLKNSEDCIPEKLDEDTGRTLEYLKNKYDLVVLTNWFKESQVERLRRTDILKFFTEVYSPEDFPMKPNKESYDIARGSYAPEQCIMVGDSMKMDVEGALNAGMKAIYLNKRNKEVPKISNKNFIKEIKNLSELMEIL